MIDPHKSLSNATYELKKHLSEIGRVSEWAAHMGFDSPKKFSRLFLQEYGIRPQDAILYVRLRSIIRLIRDEHALSNYEIARMHSMPNEKALNNFTNYHLNMSPTDIRTASGRELGDRVEQKIGQPEGTGLTWPNGS